MDSCRPRTDRRPRPAEYEVEPRPQPTSAQLRSAPVADEEYDRHPSCRLASRAGRVQEHARGRRGGDHAVRRAAGSRTGSAIPAIWTYSTDVEEGNVNLVADFLADRTGYCEQFAATMAVMARPLGIPARVNVGFTPASATVASVDRGSAHDAHAWPELYFPTVGWVRFEFTPLSDGRGIDPEYAGPAADRVDPTDPAAAQLGRAPRPRPEASSWENDARLEGDDQLAGGAAANTGPPRWPFVGARRRCSRRDTAVDGVRYAGAVSPTSRIRARAEVAWSEVRDSVRDLGYEWSRVRRLDKPRPGSAKRRSSSSLPREAFRTSSRRRTQGDTPAIRAPSTT